MVTPIAVPQSATTIHNCTLQDLPAKVIVEQAKQAEARGKQRGTKSFPTIRGAQALQKDLTATASISTTHRETSATSHIDLRALNSMSI